MQITPLTPCLGAEIRGVRLAGPVSDEDVTDIRTALNEHQVVFFVDQEPMEPDQQVALGRRFGSLHEHPAAPHFDGVPEVFVIHTDESSLVANGAGWHTDVSCEEEPPAATMLQIHRLPELGGDTVWASAVAAYDALSAPLKELLLPLTAIHSSEHVYRGRYSNRGVDDTGRTYPHAEHPVVRRHPETGRPSLFVNRAFTTRIVGLSPHESDALLRFLFDHIEQHRFAVRHRWRQYDVAFWDNRSTQHLALWDYWPEERYGHRVTIAGDAPVGYAP